MKAIMLANFLVTFVLIVAGCASSNTLSQSIVDGNTEESLKYIQSGSDLFNGNLNGMTPLHFAAMKGNVNVINALLDYGADVDVKTKILAKTPIEFAAEKNDVQVINLLIKSGAAVDFVDNRGGTALKIASFAGNKVVVKALLKAGAKVNKMQNLSSTALIEAVNGKQLETVKLLLQAGANIDGFDEKGNTALIVAAFKGYEKTLNFLLKNKANVHAKNREGQTSIIIAAFKGKKSIVDSLLSQGASIHDLTKYDRSPLHLAAIGEHAAVVNELFIKGSKPSIIEISEDDYFGTGLSHGMYGEWLISKDLYEESRYYLSVADKYFAKAEGEYLLIQDKLDWKASKNSLKSIFSIMFATYAAKTQAKINAKTSGIGVGVGVAPYRIYGSKTLDEIREIFMAKLKRSSYLKLKYKTILKCISVQHQNNSKKCTASNKELTQR